MNHIEIPSKGEFEIPSEWDELSQTQVINIMKLVLKLNSGVIDYDCFIVRAFYIIGNIKRNWLSVYREYRLSADKRRRKLADTFVIAEQLTDFIFRENDQNQKEIWYNTVKNFFPKVTVAGTEFIGPKDFLQDITFGEFRKCIDTMNIYRETKAPEDLDRFFALLYRPNRVRLEDSLIRDVKFENLVKKAAKVPLYIKTAVLLWFTTCVHYLTQTEININGRSISFAPLFPKPEANKKGNGLGWVSVLFAIAKEGVFGDANKLDQHLLTDVLLYMYDNHLQNIRLKIAQKK